MSEGPWLPLVERRREPMVRVPLAVAAVIAAMIGAHALRLLAGVDPGRFAFASGDLAAGRYGRLITYQFVHASWAHVLINSAFVLAFGVPAARFLGEGLRGSASFIVFFLLCGIAAALGYAGLAPAGAWAVVGASGAASGLMGAAALIIEGRGGLGSPLGPTALAMTGGWIILNILLGVSGLTPGAGGVPVAWQAHIVGYFAGMALIAPAAAAAGTPLAGAARGSGEDR
ncbi:MAG: rhomboid family intramembrane serine protease [Caulobacteraceae bacterium]